MEQQLDTSAPAYLADHKIGDRAILPGAAYAEMALVAAAHQLKSERIELRDIDFVQALELSADACQQVRTAIRSN